MISKLTKELYLQRDLEQIFQFPSFSGGMQVKLWSVGWEEGTERKSDKKSIQLQNQISAFLSFEIREINAA